ncbi:MAG: ABC transporter substrate-binding protein [Pelagibacterales bacterium]|nr:ABC transporter substrate-binding protein [Pelagibacterales bacterium]
MKISFKIIILLFFIWPFNLQKLQAQEEIKIGLLIPLSGKQSDIGKSIMQSVRLAINKIDNPNIKILPKDTKNDPVKTLAAAKELGLEGVKIVIGPIFNNNLIYLDELNEMIFLSLTNKNINNPKNVISAGINASSQIKTIMKFKEMNNINKTIFLIPNSNFQEEVEDAISQSKIKLKHVHIYETNPMKLTKQIEKITMYQIRKQNLIDEIKRVEDSNEANKERKINNLKKRDTLGGINFDSVIVSDFEEGLKSVFTSLLYTDVSPQRIYYITLNQWFDESFLKEESLQPLYFPSINKENYDEFIDNYKKIYNEHPNQLSFLSYDLMGLVYYLVYQNEFKIDEKIFYKKNQFKGKVGIFEINKNRINHVLNFYKVENKEFKKIF